MAVPTKLGFVICGPVSDKYCGTHVNVAMLSALIEPDSMDLERFWALDTLGITPPVESKADTFLDEYFATSISKSGNIYQVKLPWKANHGPLPTNSRIAYHRTRSVARRLAKTPDILEKYNGIIKWQLERDFIEYVPNPEVVIGREHYIPHHAVFRDSATTPVRIVYDCSCRESSYSCSLNDCLETGPVMLEDISALLCRFRLFKYAVITDIEKAFLHVGLDVSDRDVTRFYWLSDPSDCESELQVLRF